MVSEDRRGPSNAEILSAVAVVGVEVKNIYVLVEKQEKHLEKINDKTADNGNRIQSLETKTESHNKWLTGITGAIITVTVGIIAAFIAQLRGK